MRGERRLLRIGEYLIARACRHLPAGARDERYQEWVAELPAILRDPGVRPAARRAARMLGYASGTIRGTALTPGSAPRVRAHMARAAAPYIIITGLVDYLRSWPKTPLEWIGLGIGWLVSCLTVFGFWLAYRRIRGKGPGDDLTDALEARACTRARAASILQAMASAGSGNSTAGYTAVSFPRSSPCPRPRETSPAMPERSLRAPWAGVVLKLLAGQRPGGPAVPAGMGVSGDDRENLARGGPG